MLFFKKKIQDPMQDSLNQGHYDTQLETNKLFPGMILTSIKF